MTNFVNSNRADISGPINLDHVIAFVKERAGSISGITFHTLDGKKFYWRYDDKTARDEDYEELLLAIFKES